MKTEMDLLNMNQKQRLSWLRANRGTLFAVGICWIGMIAWEVLQNRTPLFLIIMVPVFAIVRLGLYRYYTRKP
jgi:hypothetical protein